MSEQRPCDMTAEELIDSLRTAIKTRSEARTALELANIECYMLREEIVRRSAEKIALASEPNTMSPPLRKPF